METGSQSRSPFQLSRGCVIASIQIDLDEGVLVSFRQELLAFLRSSGARRVILDLSGVTVMDAEEFVTLRATIDMARLMGARTVISGLQPGIVSALVDLEVDAHGIEATRTLDDAFERFTSARDEENQEAGNFEVEDAEVGVAAHETERLAAPVPEAEPDER